MAQYGEQYPQHYPQQPPQHPATAYYPGYAPEPPKDLTAFGVLAFSTALLATLFDIVATSVTGRAVRELTEDPDGPGLGVVVYGLGSVLEVLALIGGFVTGSMWLHRARTNAERMNPAADWTRSAGWAWGGWVCPLVNLWFPFQVVRDTYRATAPLGASRALIGWWWALYLFIQVGGRISSSMQDDATAADAGAVQGVAVFLSLVMVVALVLWGLVLRQVTRAQHERMYAGPPVIATR